MPGNKRRVIPLESLWAHKGICKMTFDCFDLDLIPNPVHLVSSLGLVNSPV